MTARGRYGMIYNICKKSMFVIMVLLLAFISLGCEDIPDEVQDVIIDITRGARVDSSGRVQHTVTLTNRSDKTLTRGNYMIYSQDISGKMLSSDAIYPKDVGPNARRTATVWMELPAGAKVCGEWVSAKFE